MPKKKRNFVSWVEEEQMSSAHGHSSHLPSLLQNARGRSALDKRAIRNNPWQTCCPDSHLFTFAGDLSLTINDGTSLLVQAIEKLFQLSLDTQLVPQSQNTHRVNGTLVKRLLIDFGNPTDDFDIAD